MKTKSFRKEKVQLVTLGCSKNMVDSDNIITQLTHNDYHVTHNPTGKPSEIVIINTCGFIDRAKEESINTILEYASLKNKGKLHKLYVTGCLSQRYKDNLEKEIPEVDQFFGTFDMPELIRKLNADYKHELIGERMISTPAHYAYLKISEGCNRTCSFCAIPIMRGDHRSVPIEKLIEQAKHLAFHGVKELILIAQELTYYGLDLYKKRELGNLLNELCKVDGIEWIRLHYAYPSKFPQEILEVMAHQDKICKYLDIPLQHASDHILGKMKRQITRKETEQLIKNIRTIIPNVHLRTTMLVGFPGESEADFKDLCTFVEEQKFERLGVFQYSHEEDTGAFLFEDNVTIEEKEYRAAALMEIQEGISVELNMLKINQEFNVLFDRKESEYFVGRTEFDSPEVDNEVLVPASDGYIRIGDFARIKIQSASAFDLIGQKIN